MFAPIRFVMTAIGLVLIGIALAVLAFLPTLREEARALVSRELSEATGTETEVAGLSWSFLDRGIQIDEIRLAEARDVGADIALVLRSVTIRMDWASLLQAEPRIAAVDVGEAKAAADSAAMDAWLERLRQAMAPAATGPQVARSDAKPADGADAPEEAVPTGDATSLTQQLVAALLHQLPSVSEPLSEPSAVDVADEDAAAEGK